MWNIKAPQGRIPCAIFTKFPEFVPISGCVSYSNLVGFARGVMELWGFKLRGLVSPKFSVPPSGETMRQTPKSFRDARTRSRSSITMPGLVGLGFHPPPGWPKTLNFFVCLVVCLFVCLFVTLLNVRDCAPDFATRALVYRNDFDAVG